MPKVIDLKAELQLSFNGLKGDRAVQLAIELCDIVTEPLQLGE